MEYKGYMINTAPAYTRMAYMFTHKDYDGPEDRRHGYGKSIEDCKEQIDEIEESYENYNPHK